MLSVIEGTKPTSSVVSPVFLFAALLGFVKDYKIKMYTCLIHLLYLQVWGTAC